MNRCPWCLGSESYMHYHDHEWGVPVHDDRIHFEFLILEGAQAGLSWSTVLNKRAGYREVFAEFDPERVAHFTDSRIEKLLLNPGIIRNRLKVKGVITNARRFLEVQQEFSSFDNYIWKFMKGEPRINQWKSMSQVPPTSDASDALSKDLKKRGFSFVGSTVMYAYMQACGLVNDHLIGCFRHKEVQQD